MMTTIYTALLKSNVVRHVAFPINPLPRTDRRIVEDVVGKAGLKPYVDFDSRREPAYPPTEPHSLLELYSSLKFVDLIAKLF